MAGGERTVSLALLVLVAVEADKRTIDVFSGTSDWEAFSRSTAVLTSAGI